ncbi:MAG: AAA family ATPase, partial [Patulibacter sp.]|nr:AAA family ATPase [Patulibacter sp.]
MRIHRLAIEGIGPYATRQDLDFDDLTAQGLFLLTGPTGAGKTTVLDAIVFALYGTVPGARGADGKREKGARERIVSDLRDLDTQPRVELEFTAGGRRFIVQRSPDHDRPKARGTGTTLAKATATLEERVHGDWVPRSTDFREISIELESVLGMSAVQFTQVVLLPQGEFAGFLRASVADRRRVLERLFQVDRYESAEQWFRERADAAKETLASAQADLERVVDRLSGALADLPDAEAPRADLDGADAVSGWVRARRLDVDERVLTATREAEDRAADAAAADAAHRRADEIAGLTHQVAERESAMRTPADRLPGARRWIAAHVDEAMATDDDAWAPAARDARGVAAELQARTREEARLPDLESQAVAAEAAAERASNAADQADAAVAHVGRGIETLRITADRGARAEATADGLRREQVELRGRAEASRRRDELTKQLAEAGHEVSIAERRAAEASAAVGEHPGEDQLDADAAALASERRQLDELRAGLEGEIAQITRDAAEITATRERRAELLTRRETLAAAEADRREHHLTARAAHLAAREARLDAMAAELAADLRDGEPCAVCGSPHHPHPADGSGSGDLRAAETRAEQAARQTETALAEAQQALAACVGMLDAIDVADLDVRTADLERRGTLGRTAIEQLAADDAALTARQDAAAAAIRARRVAVQESVARQSSFATLDRAAGELREARAAAAAQAGDGPSPAAELERVSTALSQAAEQARAGAEARDRIVAIERETETARATSAAARTHVAEQRQRARGLREEAARIAADLAGVRGAHATVADAARAAAEHAHTLEA